MTDSKKIKPLRGTVTSDAPQKTIVVEVTLQKKNLKYHKAYTTKKKYMVHDEKDAFHVGDVVQFIPCRPLSKRKKWRVI